jgi:hypothetical protein
LRKTGKRLLLSSDDRTGCSMIDVITDFIFSDSNKINNITIPHSEFQRITGLIHSIPAFF